MRDITRDTKEILPTCGRTKPAAGQGTKKSAKAVLAGRYAKRNAGGEGAAQPGYHGKAVQQRNKQCGAEDT